MKHQGFLSTSDKPHYENVPFEVPSSWVWTTLSEITSIIGDGLHGTPQYDIFGNYFFINGNNLINRTIVIKEETKKVSDDEYVKYRKPLNERTILVSINGTIGNVGTYNGEKIILGKSACYFNLLPDISKSYICNIIESDYFRKYAFKSATGSTIKNVPLKAINDFYIPLPPLQEQRRIVESIEHRLSFVGCIELDKEKLQETIKQAKSKILDLAIHGKLVPQDPTDEPASELLKRINPKAEITSDNGHYQKLPFMIPKSWVWCGHNDILDISGGSQPAKNHFISVPKDNYIRLYQIRDYGDNPIPVYIPEELASKRTEKGDILLARYGGSLGKVFHAETGAYNVAMAKVIFKYPNVIFKDFAYYYYLSDLYQGRLKEISRTAQAGFNSSDFNEMFFPLPPYEEQKRIVNAINKTFTILDTIAENL